MPRDDETPSPPAPRGLYGQRPSKSHDELVRREIERVRALSARERMLEALALGSGIAEALRPAEETPESPDA